MEDVNRSQKLRTPRTDRKPLQGKGDHAIPKNDLRGTPRDSATKKRASREAEAPKTRTQEPAANLPDRAVP